MVKYIPEDTTVAMVEIPEIISLAINISNCQNNCQGCHSAYLKKDIGEELNEEAIDKLVKDYKDGIDCFLFMGEGKDIPTLIRLMKYVKEKHNLKVGLYSGRDTYNPMYEGVLDYYKFGAYKEEFGPLDKETTNQVLFEATGQHSWKNITSKFWK